MKRLSFAVPVGLALAALALPVVAQSMYRYLDADGRVVYSDKPPPAAAKDVQAKSLPQNVIETDAVSFASRDAATKYPVTLYTFDCEVCKEAQALLANDGSISPEKTPLVFLGRAARAPWFDFGGILR